MKLVNFDFLKREEGAPQFFRTPFRYRTQRELKRIQEDMLSRRRRHKKRINKVFVSRGGIRL